MSFNKEKIEMKKINPDFSISFNNNQLRDGKQFNSPSLSSSTCALSDNRFSNGQLGISIDNNHNF